jgi:hypothetical protein
MLEGLIIILVVLWLLGFLTAVGGAFIHLLLLLALIVLAIRLLSPRQSI